jgi:hypothetical protein
LIANLDSDRFAVRAKAAEELERMGRVPEEALRAVLTKKPSLEVRQRVERILSGIDDRGSLTPDELLHIRALEALECMDVPEAGKTLRDLADGEAKDPQVREAAAAYQRWARRHASP